jgi:hypothetical protein
MSPRSCGPPRTRSSEGNVVPPENEQATHGKVAAGPFGTLRCLEYEHYGGDLSSSQAITD